MKPRINIHVSNDLYVMLCDEARRPGVTKTAIIERALRSYFSPESKLNLEERLLKRMDAFDLRQSSIEKDVAINQEGLFLFVLYWLTRIEPIPDGQRDAAQALGRRRFDHFMDQVAEKFGAAELANRFLD